MYEEYLPFIQILFFRILQKNSWHGTGLTKMACYWTMKAHHCLYFLVLHRRIISFKYDFCCAFKNGLKYMTFENPLSSLQFCFQNSEQFGQN